MHPLKGSDATRKPDISCWFPGSEFDWRHIATFAEVKNCTGMPNERSSYIEAAGKASCMLYAQDSHHAALCIHILGSQIYLTIFDHGGSLSTTSFDIHLCPHSFLCILIGVLCATLDTLRFNTLICWREDKCNGNVVQLKELEFVKDNTTYTIKLTKVLFISDNLHG